jgi:Leucine-rich repeat (LRR) protein
LTPTSFSVVGQLHSLKTLYISSCALISLDCLSNLTNLTDLHAAHLTLFHSIDWSGLKALTQLKTLDLEGNHWSDSLADAIPRTVEQLYLGGVYSKKRAFGFLWNMKRLKLLSFNSSSQLRSKTLEPIQGLKELRVLELQRCVRLKSKIIKYLQELKNIESIDISGCEKLSWKKVRDALRPPTYSVVIIDKDLSPQ